MLTTLYEWPYICSTYRPHKLENSGPERRNSLVWSVPQYWLYSKPSLYTPLHLCHGAVTVPEVYELDVEGNGKSVSGGIANSEETHDLKKGI